jgi:hypothetical protein
MVENLRSKELPVNYISPAISHLNVESDHESIVSVLSVH